MIYNKLAMYYDQFVDHNLNDIYLKLIKKHFNEGNIIDLGCGTGPLSILLAKRSFHVTATDISENMLERAYYNSVNEDVKINFFVHDILDPLNNFYDIITMSSDVINYLDNPEKVERAFKHVRNIMEHNSIFMFDFLKIEYLNNLVGHSEKVEIDNSELVWEVVKTDITAQVKHIVTIDNEIETHIQTTFEEDEYIKLLLVNDLKVLEKVILEDRIVFVCKIV